MATESFDYNHFTWETNVNMIHYAGTWAVPIRYDLEDEDLYPLLDSINGVFFAGGGALLIDVETGEQTQLYKTAKKIFDYMKSKKDSEQEDFHLFGICQGFELLHYLANEDNKDTLSENVIYNESRPVNWQVPNPKETWLFQDFPDELLDRMG